MYMDLMVIASKKPRLRNSAAKVQSQSDEIVCSDQFATLRKTYCFVVPDTP